MADAHGHPAFTHAVTYAVTVTVTVEGGARPQTAHHRAGKLAERLADTAARAAHVVDARAVAGPVIGGQGVAPGTVHFARANTGPGTYGEPGKLSRYLDPDHERALVARAEATGRHQARRQADRQRRHAVGCRNADRQPGPLFLERRRCECVYCDPALHLAIARQPADGWAEARCLCGAPVGCSEHAKLALVVLDDDPTALRDLQALTAVPPEGETS